MKLIIILLVFLTGCTTKTEIETYTAPPELIEEVKEMVVAPIQEEYSAESVIYSNINISSEHLKLLCSDWGIDYEIFERCSNEYGINPDYAMAVFILETGNGKSNLWLNHHNPAGIKKSSKGYQCDTTQNGFCSYPNSETGIEQLFVVMNRLATEYNRTTIESMRSVWSESDDSEIIVKIMNDIRKE